MKRSLVALLGALTLTGCFTLHQSEYPKVEVGAVDGKDAKVQLAGFEAVVTTYVPVYGYETVFREDVGPYRRRRGGYFTTVRTETYYPQSQTTPVFLDRATEMLETHGFNLKNTEPDYRVEVKFSGPFLSATDGWVKAAWCLFSALSADYGTETWTAKLKIYDIKSGKLLFTHDYSERYQAVVWGPIPLFSPTGSDKTSHNLMQSWCLSALTDTAVADAMAFLSERK